VRIYAMTKKINAAIAYDFDGTLAPGNMQEHSFLPSLGIKNPNTDFWPKVKVVAKKHDMDEILAYMHLMLKEADYKGKSICRDEFVNHGKGMRFFEGVEDWFARINDYANDTGVNLKHYIISSGLREMIEGTSIAKNFSAIFASGYMYNQDQIAIWPALAVNYTNKTQYIFRINKGVENSWDNKSLNKYMPSDRPIPQENIIYLGDGETDIPAMKMLNYLGGHSVGVYEPENTKAKKVCDELIEHKRAKHSCPADYRDGSDLDKTIKSIITKIANP
jgi:2-hydroxy-3-keto-5-methylthiopentenyl-1-phosphate phosphatase